MGDSPIQELIDLLNKLSEKYNFEEDDINAIRESVFKIENGDNALLSEADDFVSPEEEVYENSFEEEHIGKED